ncbi:hypothetical protein ABPG72_020366 [Tetrahymena utriculariae]
MNSKPQNKFPVSQINLFAFLRKCLKLIDVNLKQIIKDIQLHIFYLATLISLRLKNKVICNSYYRIQYNQRNEDVFEVQERLSNQVEKAEIYKHRKNFQIFLARLLFLLLHSQENDTEPQNQEAQKDHHDKVAISYISTCIRQKINVYQQRRHNYEQKLFDQLDTSIFGIFVVKIPFTLEDQAQYVIMSVFKFKFLNYGEQREYFRNNPTIHNCVESLCLILILQLNKLVDAN